MWLQSKDEEYDSDGDGNGNGNCDNVSYMLRGYDDQQKRVQA